MSSTISQYFKIIRMEEVSSILSMEHDMDFRNQFAISFEKDEDLIEGEDSEEEDDLSDSDLPSNNKNNNNANSSEWVLVTQHQDTKARLMACIDQVYKSVFKVDLEIRLKTR